MDLLFTLEWKLECVKPRDLLEHFIVRLPFPVEEEDKRILRQYSEVYIDLAYTGIFPCFILFSWWQT